MYGALVVFVAEVEFSELVLGFGIDMSWGFVYSWQERWTIGVPEASAIHFASTRLLSLDFTSRSLTTYLTFTYNCC